MNDILKQRLVGALVLIALSVVFWPIIFVEPEEARLDTATQLPTMPRMATEQLATPMPLSTVAPVKDRDQETAAVETATVATAAVETAFDEPLQVATSPQPAAPVPPAESPASKPKLDERGIPVAWILQVASVSASTKAEQLRLQLQDLGYRSYSKKIKRNGSTLFRVYVGPKFERAKLQSAKGRIDKQFKVNSIIRRYEP